MISQIQLPHRITTWEHFIWTQVFAKLICFVAKLSQSEDRTPKRGVVPCAFTGEQRDFDWQWQNMQSYRLQALRGHSHIQEVKENLRKKRPESCLYQCGVKLVERYVVMMWGGGRGLPTAKKVSHNDDMALVFKSKSVIQCVIQYSEFIHLVHFTFCTN